jgi:hypothetical protein
MDIKPVKDARHPKYPLKEQCSEEFLKTCVPKRWAQSAAAKVALGTLAAMTLAGCGQGAEKGIIKNFVNDIAGATITPATPEGTVAPATLNVAPLFVHGEGRGAFGCVMVAPPVFLSEYDALAVINEVAKEYGLKFSSEDSPELSNVLQPVTDISPQTDSDTPKNTEGNKITTLKTDFSDSEHGIAIEYVSVEDVKEWAEAPSGASVEEYNTKDAADQLSDALDSAVSNDYSTFDVGVLYDPCEQYRPENLSNEEEWKQAETKVREMSEEQLKAQAKDFFEWLKSQGVI